ncbi:hypothetical protein ACWEK5_41375 [Rhodococcus koreensis]
MATFYSSGPCYLGPGAAGHFYLDVPLLPPLFALAYPDTTELGKHSLWTEWHGISRFNGMMEDWETGAPTPAPPVYSYWIRVQNEHGDRSETFTIKAYRP